MRYKVSYGDTRSGAETTEVVRHADNACDAIENLCGQYGWGCYFMMFDETGGNEWAQYKYDRSGGNNCDGVMTAIVITEV